MAKEKDPAFLRGDEFTPACIILFSVCWILTGKTAGCWTASHNINMSHNTTHTTLSLWIAFCTHNTFERTCLRKNWNVSHDSPLINHYFFQELGWFPLTPFNVTEWGALAWMWEDIMYAICMFIAGEINLCLWRTGPSKLWCFFKKNVKKGKTNTWCRGFRWALIIGLLYADHLAKSHLLGQVARADDQLEVQWQDWVNITDH